jgi:hypothetical protein
MGSEHQDEIAEYPQEALDRFWKSRGWSAGMVRDRFVPYDSEDNSVPCVPPKASYILLRQVGDEWEFTARKRGKGFWAGERSSCVDAAVAAEALLAGEP